MQWLLFIGQGFEQSFFPCGSCSRRTNGWGLRLARPR